MKRHPHRKLKRHSALLLISLLLFLLVLWRAVSFANMVLQSKNVTTTQVQTTHAPLVLPDTSYTPPKTLHLTRTKAAGFLSYEGSVTIPGCDTLLTSMSVGGAGASSLSLDFIVSRADLFCTDQASSSAPFLVSYNGGAGTKEQLSRVTINGKPVSVSF